MRPYMPQFRKAFEQGWRASARREGREEIAWQMCDISEGGQKLTEADCHEMGWIELPGVYRTWYRQRWFVQQLANGLWICGPNPAEPGSWTSAELLYVSREDAMRACERRAAALAQRKTEREDCERKDC